MREQLKKLLVKFQVPKKSSEGKTKLPPGDALSVLLESVCGLVRGSAVHLRGLTCRPACVGNQLRVEVRK